jgi:PAS domain S-box-containing protein
MNFPSLDTFTAISTIIGAITAIFGLWKVLKPVLKALNNAGKLLIEAEKHAKLIEQIAAELKPNGGNSVRDILDRMEKDMISFDTKIKSLIIYNDVAMYETDKEGNYLWVSKEWCNLTGLLPSDASGNGWVVGIHEDDREKVYEEWQSAIEQTRDFNMNYRVGSQSTGFKSVHARATCVKNSKGKVMGCIGTIEPVASPSSSGGSSHGTHGKSSELRN